MAYSPRQWRAIRYYLESHGFKPQLGHFPYIYYTDLKGETRKIHINSIEDIYTGHLETEKRRKAEERKANKRVANQTKSKEVS